MHKNSPFLSKNDKVWGQSILHQWYKKIQKNYGEGHSPSLDPPSG